MRGGILQPTARLASLETEELYLYRYFPYLNHHNTLPNQAIIACYNCSTYLNPDMNTAMKKYLSLGLFALAGGIIISFLSTLFHLNLTKLFFTLPNISGWDGAAHVAIMDVYAKSHFPSTWGWLSNWQAGMPFPILYPPLMYLIGSFFNLFLDNSVIVYKLLSGLILLIISSTTLIWLLYIYKKEFPDLVRLQQNIKQNWKIYTAIILGASIMLGINTGSPGSRSLFFNSMLAQNISMIFLIPALLSIISRSKFFAVIGSLCWAMIYISSIHTALSCIPLSGILILFQKRQDIFFYIKRAFFIHIFGLLGASFWIIPMLGSYAYFSGSIQATPYNSLELLMQTWPHLIIAAYGLYLSYFCKNDNGKYIFRLSASVFLISILTISLYFVSQVLEIDILLPIYFHRWFETFFFLLTIPYVFALISFIKNGITISNFKINGVLIVLLIFILPVANYILVPKMSAYHFDGHVYKKYADGELASLAKTIAESKKMTMVQSYVLDSTQDILDAEIGRLEGKTAYSNLVESSINSMFFRMSRNTLSPHPDTWGLTNFYQPITSGAIQIHTQQDLLKFFGIETLVLIDKTTENRENLVNFGDPDFFTITKPSPSFTVAEINNPAPFASIIRGNIGLFIGDTGFRNRKISDPDYSRFQETIFTNRIFNNLFTVYVDSADVDELVRLSKKSRFTLITNYKHKKEEELVKYIDIVLKNYDKNPHVIFLLDDDSKTFENLEKRYSRYPTKIITFKTKKETYPFDPIIKKIRDMSTTTVQEIPLQDILRNNTNTSIILPSLSSLPHKLGTISNTVKDPNNNTEFEWVFIRQSFHPGWIPEVNSVQQKSYLASPGFTIIPVSQSNLKSTTTLSMTFPPSKDFVSGHYTTLISFLFLLIYSIYCTVDLRNKKHEQR